jgi:hypothetical protein
MSTIATQNAEIQGMMRKFAATWAKVLPKLQRDPRVPVEFVIDTVKALIDGIGNPVADIEVSLVMQAKVLGDWGTFVKIVAGPTAGMSFDMITEKIKRDTANATSTMRFLFTERLMPLAKEASAAKARGDKMMKIPVAGVGSDLFKEPFDQTVLATMQNGSAALASLREIQDQLESTLIGKFAKAIVDAGQAALDALSALATAIGTIGAGFYSAIKTLILVAKIALVGAIGYVGYRVYTGVRGEQRQLAGPSPPASNPRRRRRRTARRRLRA